MRALSRWVSCGHGIEVVGVYLTALGLAVLVADLGFGAFQIAEAELANALVPPGPSARVPYLPCGQLTGLLWLAGLPLWSVGGGLRRNSTLWLNRHASLGEAAGPLQSRYALRWPSTRLFGRRPRK